MTIKKNPLINKMRNLVLNKGTEGVWYYLLPIDSVWGFKDKNGIINDESKFKFFYMFNQQSLKEFMIEKVGYLNISEYPNMILLERRYKKRPFPFSGYSYVGPYKEFTTGLNIGSLSPDDHKNVEIMGTDFEKAQLMFEHSSSLRRYSFSLHDLIFGVNLDKVKMTGPLEGDLDTIVKENFSKYSLLKFKKLILQFSSQTLTTYEEFNSNQLNDEKVKLISNNY
jgi:hypothetical protein